MKVNTYLNFQGNAEEAMGFYRSIFGGEFSSVVKFKDMPMEGVEIPAADQDKMMHISLPLDEDEVLMASDALESLGQKLVVGNNVYVSLHPDSREEADRLFAGLSEGADIEMPMGDQIWGDYFGSLRDKFGIGWMINHGVPQEE